MSVPVIMPRFEMSQEKATVMRWLRKPGEAVRRGDVLLEVETDKVVMDVEAPDDGVLAGITVNEGDIVPVATVIAVLLAPGETHTPSVDPIAPPAPAATPVARRVAAEAGIDLLLMKGNGRKITRRDVEQFIAAPRPAATPAARRVARETGVNLADVSGTGPGGRVQQKDVAVAGKATGKSGAGGGDAVGLEKRIPLTGMRRTIADRLQASWQAAPHATFTATADMTNALALLSDRKVDGGSASISLTALLVRVCAWALGRHPTINSTLDGEAILLHDQAHIAVAVALDDGLVAPVIRHADALNLDTTAARLNDLILRARERRLAADESRGGTFTLSNLGMFGVDAFTAIINPPQCAILAVGRVSRQPVVVETGTGDEIAIRPMLRLTLSADHRAIDGAVAAAFLGDVVRALEQPARLI